MCTHCTCGCVHMHIMFFEYNHQYPLTLVNTGVWYLTLYFPRLPIYIELDALLPFRLDKPLVKVI